MYVAIIFILYELEMVSDTISKKVFMKVAEQINLICTFEIMTHCHQVSQKWKQKKILHGFVNVILFPNSRWQ